jgi:hypothetical protein
MPKNLWGDLSTLERVRTPKAILEEQASYLGEATRGALVGAVDQMGTGEFLFSFSVRVPALNNYEYSIFSVRHGIELYPAQIVCAKPLVTSKCKDQEELEKTVEQILSSTDVKLILSRLLSQVA